MQILWTHKLSQMSHSPDLEVCKVEEDEILLYGPSSYYYYTTTGKLGSLCYSIT